MTIGAFSRWATWYKDNTYTNLVNFQRWFQKWSGVLGAGDYEDIYDDKPYLDDDPPRQPPPAAYLDGKQETIGALWIGRGTIHADMGDMGSFYGRYLYRETQIGNKDVQRPDKVPSRRTKKLLQFLSK